MRSMTGYGRGSATSKNFLVQVELRTVNGRFLEIRTKLPKALFFAEAELRALLGKDLKRGMVDAQVTLQRKSEASDSLIDRALVGAYAKELEVLSKEMAIPSGANVLGLMRLPGTIAGDESLNAGLESEAKGLLIQAAQTALAELVKMRSLEGKRLGEFLSRDLSSLAQLQDDVISLLPKAAEQIRTKLLERMQKALADQALQLDPTRVVQEVAFYIDRSDVTEEMDRLRSHLEQFKGLLASADSQGKRFDFLLQEVSREVNTLGSKANFQPVSQLVVEMKLVAEKLREQVQNLE